jgi:hypothetical protein
MALGFAAWARVPAQSEISSCPKNRYWDRPLRGQSLRSYDATASSNRSGMSKFA